MKAIVWGGLALLALLTFHHNRTVWTSERALWANAVQWAPDHPRPWINLGRAWLLEGDQALARDAWQRASVASQVPWRTPYERAYGGAAAETNLAWLDLLHQHYPEVVGRLNRVLAEQPHVPEALQMRALARLKLGDCHGAQDDYAQFRAYAGTRPGGQGELPRC